MLLKLFDGRSSHISKQIIRLTLALDAAIIALIIVFFWFPSALPREFSASGIVESEWRIVIGILSLVGILFLWQSPQLQGLAEKRHWSVVTLLGCLLIGLLLIQWMIPEPSSPLPVDRADWFWLLALLIPTQMLRWFFTRQIWPRSPLDLWFVVFILLVIVSSHFAPFPSRGIGMAGRPVLGFVIIIHLMTVNRETGSLNYVLKISVSLCILIGVMALLMTQWNEKSEALSPIIEMLPQIDRIFINRSINPNEMGGVLAWIVPLAAGLAIYPWTDTDRQWRWLSMIGFALGFTGLFLGQSRFAIAGVFVGLTMLATLVVASPWRKWVMVGMLLFLIVEVAIVFNIIGPQTADNSTEQVSAGLSQRDSNTSRQRLEIWKTAVQIIQTHPLTGVGMDRFRYEEVKRAFPVIGFDVADPNNPTQPLRPRPPHTHNELLQFGTDFGIPGLVLALGIYGGIVHMGYQTWQQGSRNIQIITAAAMVGILAHVIYGIGDAIPVWDRFAFVFWIVTGVIASSYKNSAVTQTS